MKIEDSIYNLISLSSKLLSKNPLFFLINSYTTGLQAGVLAYMLNTEIAIRAEGASVNADEIGLPVEKSYDKNITLILPCGASGRCYWN